MALGALIIKERCSFTDRETVEQIIENPYLQYLIGLKNTKPFDPSLMVHFRKRFGKKALREINEEICQAAREADKKKNKDDDNRPEPPTGDNKEATEETNNPDQDSSFEVYPANQGKLILDASCAPADIHYPTDLSLLNKAREKQLPSSSLGKNRWFSIFRKIFVLQVHGFCIFYRVFLASYFDKCAYNSLIC